MDVENLEIEAAMHALRHLAALRGLTMTENLSPTTGRKAVLAPEGSDGEVFFAAVPRGGSYVSLSLVLVVDEEFFTEHVEEILAVTSRYDTSLSLSREEALSKSESLGDGEAYLHLALRIFLPGLTDEVFGLAIGNLRAVRNALGEAFP